MKPKKYVKTTTRFSDRQKKLIVAESLLPGASINAIINSYHINKDILDKWKYQYGYDHLVTSIISNFNKQLH